MKKSISGVILKSIAVKSTLTENVELFAQLESFAITCLNSLRSGGKIIFVGNGVALWTHSICQQSLLRVSCLIARQRLL